MFDEQPFEIRGDFDPWDVRKRICAKLQLPPGTRLSDADLQRALLGNTVCVGTGQPWEAQEQHLAPNVLKDYKLGTDPKDPTAEVGRWVVSGTQTEGIVTYTYGTLSYSYGVCRGNSQAARDNLTFCPAGPTPGPLTPGVLKAGTAAGC